MTRRGSEGIIHSDSPRRIEVEDVDPEFEGRIMNVSWAILAVFLVVLFISMLFSFRIAMISIFLFLLWNVYISIRLEEIMYTWITIRKKDLSVVYHIYISVMTVIALFFLYLAFTLPRWGIVRYL